MRNLSQLPGVFEHAGGNEVSLRPLDASGTHTLGFEILHDRRSG